jgi:hypothetical protein
MQAASFWVNHQPSNSRALVEFGLVDRRVVLTGVFFVRGNVMDINVIRELYLEAKRFLLW